MINMIAFHWSLFEFINIAWPRSYAVSPDAPWWQLWAATGLGKYSEYHDDVRTHRQSTWPWIAGIILVMVARSV
jgi:hypothetical protein